MQNKNIWVAVAFALTFVGINEVHAWTEPASAPPNGNVVAPLRLPLSSLTLSGGSPLNLVFDTTSGSDYNLSYNSTAGGFGIWDNTASTWRFMVKNSTGNVGIGTTNPGAKLDVGGVSDGGITIKGYATGPNTLVSSYNVYTGPTCMYENVQDCGYTEEYMQEQASDPNNYQTVNVYSSSGTGVEGTGSYVGVRGVGLDESNGVGVIGEGEKYGVYGYATPIAGSPTNPSYGVYCGGSGTFYCGGSRPWINNSDLRLKENVYTIKDALDKVLGLRGVTYEWKSDKTDDKNLGFIAQEVKNVLPEVVSQDEDGYYSINESSITAVLVEAVKELKAENDDLRSRLETLEAKLR